MQGKSGFLARTPNPWVGYANDSSGSHSLAAFAGNFTVGTVAGTRTPISQLKRLDSGPLSYDGMDWCSVLESNQAGLEGARVTVSPGSVPVQRYVLVPGAD